MKTTLILPTVAGLLAAASTAQAGVMASATTDLNMRAGPGAWHELVGVIEADGEVDVLRCYAEANWCEVSYNGMTGWAFGAYLGAMVEDQPIAVIAPEAQQKLQITTVTVEEQNTEATSAAVGAGWGAIAGSLVAGPAGAAIGAILATPAAVLADPGPEVTSYVTANPVDPVYLDGELMVGAGVPETVTIYEIPETDFAYLNVNGVPVIIELEGRQIVRVVN